ncbi:MAG: fatty acid desaturase [Pseudohongiella sp.]|nr:MAG: fatty acid desaturase [Pseudohongiella sp.]
MTRILEQLDKSEIQQFTRRSNLQAWFAVIVNWAIVGLAMVMVALWTNPGTILLALILIGGRQLGFGALMHECGHNSFFETKGLNQWVGTWLCAAPMLYRLEDYVSNHLQHHRNMGTEQDPDLSRYQHYPVSKVSLRRKMLRDLTGRTSFGFVKNLLRTNGVIGRDEDGKLHFSMHQLLTRLHAPLISNLVLLSIFTATGYTYLYLLWIGAFFSFYMFFSRIRNLAEHAVVPDLFHPDPLMNTRTVLASWWEKLTFAPNSVNYHLEHHLLPAVPKYRLQAFHEYLKRKGLLDSADIVHGYGNVIAKLAI